ncbi:hypothetical protein BDQ17DRAFT_1366382 [Cyathus striatus]|nr:hypothetical protein BDQ17DRAFT_1366382 [Cyathus striatus]
MAPKRGGQVASTLTHDTLSPHGPPSPSTSRSSSPSPLAQLFTRPVKWFNRSASASKVSSMANDPPRSSLSSAGGRKHKISRPTDPRPILDGYVGPGSRSVLDLSTTRGPPGSADSPHFHVPSTPSSGLGDLRNISRRGCKISTANFSPINTSFKEKIHEYRNRSDSNASAMSPSTPTSVSSIPVGRHPFPSLKSGGSPSTSPPRSSTLPPPVSISISAPGMQQTDTAGGGGGIPPPQHVHTRSHSFTPKLPSKLSTPRFPSSPKRMGSASSERSVEEYDKPPTPVTAPAIKTSFGLFGSGSTTKLTLEQPGPSPSSAPANRGTTVHLSPPLIIEPPQDMEEHDPIDPRRSSQIIYHSGFLNRLVDVPSHMNNISFAQTKGWKPYKAEIKGSKVFFYKPPGDRNTGVKDLFPTGLVPPSQEEIEEEMEALVEEAEEEKKGKGREMVVSSGSGTTGRKKRAFWGRRTHPDVARDGNGRIEKGTFEALVHEAVFATTFLVVNADEEREKEEERDEDSEEEDDDEHREKKQGKKAETEQERQLREWRDFASTLIFALPSIVGRNAFELEFARCCSYLVSGADENLKEREVSRVVWLAREYVRYHGAPVDPESWNQFREETIPGIELSVSLSEDEAAGNVGSPETNTESTDTSPNVNTFSPRPDGPRLTSIIEVLDSPIVQTSISKQSLDLRTFEHQNSLHPSYSYTISRMPWGALNEEGLSRILTLYHRSILDQTPDNITAEFVTGNEPCGGNDDEDIPQSTFAPLFGNEDQPHWLTKLLLLQILGADTSGSGAHFSSPHVRTHSRSEVISVWASYRCALCSRPIARLDKVWKRVDPQALAAVESWVYPNSSGNIASVFEPHVTTWAGDMKARIGEELTRAKGDGSRCYMSLFDSVKRLISRCPRKVGVIDGEIDSDVRKMIVYWREMAAEGGGSGSMAAKFQRIEQFMSLSLAAEPRRRGLFEPHFWTRSSSSTPHASLVPLLFPEALPTISLIDRAQLIRGRMDSDADMQLLRGIDAQLRLDERRNLQRLDSGKDSTKQAILGQGGTLISVFNGDLMLSIQPGGMDSTPPSRAPSRPPSSVMESSGGDKSLSRAPSIRVKPNSSHGLEKKTSFARRSSLPSISQRQDFVTSEPSSEPPLRMIVQAGTLNHLVDILVHGLQNISVSVADDNGEMTLREGMTRDLIVDHGEFARVWWNVFRSFVTPLVFFELLRKLYITTQPSGSVPPIPEYLKVMTSRIEVLETMKEWLMSGAGAQDVLDDPQLFTAVRTFLDSSSDHIVYKSATFHEPAVVQSWANLTKAKESFTATFTSQTMRPIIHRGPHHHRPNTTANGARTRNVSTRDPPDLDRMDPEEFVDNLDGMACAALSNVTEEDLYITADLLEVQSADRTGWFIQRDPLQSDETVEIQTIYSHIQDVEPSSMISELGQEALYRLLPPGVRSCVRAYGIIRKWLIAKIVAPRLGLRGRQARIELLLQAIEIARLRNAEGYSSSPTRITDQPCIRSFVEAVATSALLSVESRMHHRAWQSVAVSRRCQNDSLFALLQRPYNQTTTSQDPLTVDMGWLLERMLEIIGSPDVVDATTPEGHSLVNFNKRRHLCNLITKARSLPAARRTIQSDEINRRGFERLNNIEKEVLLTQFDHRGIREEAIREATSSNGPNGTPSVKRPVRPFQRIVSMQMDKNRRDKNLRVRLQKEKQHEIVKNERRDDLLNRAMRPRKPSLQKQHRNKKSMSAFLNFMRPISSAFGAETLQPTGAKRTASELDFTPSGKPSLVLNITDARVAQFINNERSYMFQLDTEDGGHYFLQAVSKREMTKWIETIARVTKMAAKRRLTYLGNSPKPRISDHIHDHPITPSRDPKAVFGVELDFLLRREAGSDIIPPGTIPSVIEQCLREIEERGLTEVGIVYRIAGAASEISTLKEAYNRGESPIKRTTDIHAVCDLVKSWFRVLPEPVFPAPSYYRVIDAMKLEDLDSRLAGVRDVVQTLPQANFDLLRRVSEHLDVTSFQSLSVTDFEEHNHMTAEALAIVFSPNLLRAPQNDFVMILNNMGHAHKLVKALITHFHVIFDAEPEAHSDDETDPPILEEDEEEDEEPLREQPYTHEPETYTPN